MKRALLAESSVDIPYRLVHRVDRARRPPLLLRDTEHFSEANKAWMCS
jgi:hypothetical protein